MIPAEVYDKSIRSGNVDYLTFKIKDPDDINVFKSFIRSLNGPMHCNGCDKDIAEIPEEDMYIRVDNPIGMTFLNLSTVLVKCPHCGALTSIGSADYAAFKTVTAYVVKLRQAYARRK